MSGEVYFDGDPERDSRRRHLERVLKGGTPRRRWPWVLAILAGGAWTAWRMTHPRGQTVEQSPPRGATRADVQPTSSEQRRR